ncbi:MAG: aspartate kinase [Muribaculaceae bacterium]|nr:aspartate kinase [Muribaculaceae bacterium]MDE6551875.1 aspartate kinase [Muribaculaceae bacterium]
MNVLKFGGTSVGTVESLKNVRSIVEALPSDTVVVVSALGGLTDRLIATARLAAEGGDWRTEADAIAERHYIIIEELVRPDRKQSTLTVVGSLLDELRRTYEGVSLIGDLPAKTLDVIVSLGERMSAPIVAGIIKNGHLHNSLDFIKTEKWFDKNIADASLTRDLIIKEFVDIEKGPHVTGGFISQDRDTGEITNLGRGGSDYTAALIAAALDADMLDIWTDVDGFMTADPRIIKDAIVLPAMSFIESMELCTFGAKVIYPPTIYPVFHKNIPIRILNTFNPTAPGTLISDASCAKEYPVKGVTAIRNTCLVRLSGNLTENVAGINTRAYNALARNGVSVFLLAQPGENHEFSFAIASADRQVATRALNEEFAPELIDGALDSISFEDGLSTIAVVGEGIRHLKGVNGRILNTLMRFGIKPLACSEGNSDTTFSFVVEEKDTVGAIKAIHGLFF